MNTEKELEPEKLYPFNAKLKGKVITELRRQTKLLDRASAGRWTITAQISNLIMSNKVSRIE